MTNSKFKIGDRVVVSSNYHWAKGIKGKISEPPESLKKGLAYNGCYRFVETVKGVLIFYWVLFDEQQYDADGDGPYGGGEIDSDYLERIAY